MPSLLFQFVLSSEHHRGRDTARIPHNQADSRDQHVSSLVSIYISPVCSGLSDDDHDQVRDWAPGV